MAATVVNSLREDASRGGGSLLPSPIRARLSLSPCVSPLSLLPLAPVNWCVGAGWTQITREEFGLSNPRWSCAPLSPLPRSLLLSFALFPVSSLIFLSSFLLLPSCSSSYIYIRFPFLLANNNIFPTNIRSRDFNFFLFFFFVQKLKFSSFIFWKRNDFLLFSSKWNERLLLSQVFLQSIADIGAVDRCRRSTRSLPYPTRSLPLGHVTSHCQVVYKRLRCGIGRLHGAPLRDYCTKNCTCRRCKRRDSETFLFCFSLKIRIKHFVEISTKEKEEEKKDLGIRK